MAWRFRKSFKVIPGVRLNLSRRGLSATIGASPVSFNVGARGIVGTATIPGTGISLRHRLSDSSTANESPAGAQPAPSPVARLANLQPPVDQISSASTGQLTSESLREFRKFLQDAYHERKVLEREIDIAASEKAGALMRYQKWHRGILFKRLFKNALAARKDLVETAVAKFDELSEQLKLTSLPIQIDISETQSALYERMRDAFASLSECSKTWDVTGRSNRATEQRSITQESVTREPVRFRLGECDLLRWEKPVPRMANFNGGDLYLYPGFLLCRVSTLAFSVIDLREVKLECRRVNFIESDTVPTDSKIVGQTWAKANKDGGPDRRFANNYQTPIVAYGAFSMSSPGGLREEYQVSNPDLAERFGRAWDAFLESLALNREHDGPTASDF